MKKHIYILLTVIGSVVTCADVTGQSVKNITVKINQPAAVIKPTMWGIFFEDINLAADGGLYAELVKNRSFEFNLPLMGWKEQKKGTVGGSILVLNRGEKNQNNPRFIRVKNAVSGNYGMTNEGFRGMGVQKDKRYDFSVWAKPFNNSKLQLRVELVNAKGEIIGSTSISPNDAQWKKYSASFVATTTDQKAQLNIWFEGKGAVDLDMVSLFPQDTWKSRPGGLRADLVQLLADLKPGFIRFPGGCIVEGRDLANRYQWKKTVGKVEDRQLIINRWNTEFANRSAPDYFQSFGLGFYEYFLLSEDIGASPLPILNCGMACQFNTSEVVPTEQLDPYIQDALDLIEFANGSVSTKWGKLRAAMGHPSPFNLKMMGVGNEQWGPQYIERFTYFAKAIKQKYPAIQLINSVGPNPDGELFNFLNDTLRKMHADILDEHYYKSPEWFLQNAKRYDVYDRKGPKIFAGEYAAHAVGIPNGKTKNNWRSALAEAAFMTGLERNADIVNMASYAPLFAHVDGWQWTPDLIWFDNLQSYGTPNYYVQKLFSNNRGSQVVPVTMDNEVMAGKDSLYTSACIDKTTNELIIKIANTIGVEQSVSFNLDGLNTVNSKALQTVLRSDDLNGVNSFEQPAAIVPVMKVVDVKNKTLSINLSPNSFTVIRLKL
ncbi:MAG: alpha-L-arabinofuranosidase C-terminal domain-containing protein [Bacteroidota bacterium]